jgi:hypothetical protein
MFCAQPLAQLGNAAPREAKVAVTKWVASPRTLQVKGEAVIGASTRCA